MYTWLVGNFYSQHQIDVEVENLNEIEEVVQKCESNSEDTEAVATSDTFNDDINKNRVKLYLFVQSKEIGYINKDIDDERRSSLLEQSKPEASISLSPTGGWSCPILEQSEGN